MSKVPVQVLIKEKKKFKLLSLGSLQISFFTDFFYYYNLHCTTLSTHVHKNKAESFKLILPLSPIPSTPSIIRGDPSFAKHIEIL